MSYLKIIGICIIIEITGPFLLGAPKFYPTSSGYVRPVHQPQYLIMGKGQASEHEMFAFVRKYNPNISQQRLSYIVKTYIWEAYFEGVNHDVAFAQMCYETNFLRFGDGMTFRQNNFGRLSSHDHDASETHFLTIKDGIRAHIQHLKAQGSTSRLSNPCLDPLFSSTERGSVKYITDLSFDHPSKHHYGRAIQSKIDELLNLKEENL